MKIGVLADSFRLSFRENIEKAAQVGADGVQLYATSGELAPENLTEFKRKEYLKVIKDAGLEISAICGDLGQGFMNAEKNPGLIEKSKRIMDLAVEWGANVITTHIGMVPPEGLRDPVYRVMLDACRQLADYAKENGAYFAIETGPETAAALRRFLMPLRNPHVAVNFDPANLVMVAEDNPIVAVGTLQKHIVHTHAKDGKSLKHMTDAQRYAAYSGDPEARAMMDGKFIEVPLGQGDVNIPAWVAALRSVKYDGYLTIEREVGEDPEADIRMAVEYLRGLI